MPLPDVAQYVALLQKSAVTEAPAPRGERSREGGKPTGHFAPLDGRGDLRHLRRLFCLPGKNKKKCQNITSFGNKINMFPMIFI